MSKAYIDARCFQDPNYAYRGIGHHGISVLKYGAKFLGQDFELVGLLDPLLDPLSEDYKAVFDSIQHTCGEITYGGHDLFIQPSPMTHDSSRYGKFLGRKGVLSAAIIHDFIPLQFETDRYLPTLKERLGYTSALVWTKQFDLFFPNSEYSGQQLVEILGVAKNKTHVTGVAVRNSFKELLNKRLVSGKSKFKPGEYFIVVAGADFRKNVEVVLAAQGKLLLKGMDLGLIIVGSYSQEYCEHLMSVFLAEGGKNDKLQFCMGITDQELGALYSGAIGAICPSKIEGFSIPIIEALTFNCPVLASACHAHLELIKQKNALFDPSNAAELALLMENICTNQEVRRDLLMKQRRVPERFTEEAVATRFWNPILEELGSRKKRVKLKATKPKIAFVTPYPPDHSGVADYSERCLEKLCKYAQIDVYTDAVDFTRSASINAFKPISSLPYISAEYDRVISVIGNSNFHTKMLNNLKSFGGCCIAHDSHLFHYYYYLVGKEKTLEMACQSLGRPISLEELQDWMEHAKKLPTLFFDELIASSQPLIVHSRVLQRNVEKIYSYRPEYLPFGIQREFQEYELSPDYRMKVRRALNIPEGRLVIVTLGMLHEVKGPLDCISAVHILRQGGIDAHLYFVGECYSIDPPEMKVVRELGLEGAVHWSEKWMSSDDYRNYILAADFAIQLRKYRLGVLSGAMCDCISAGLPVVSNKDLVESMEAKDVAYTVPDDLNPVLIAEKIFEGYQLGHHQCRLTKGRKEYTEAHSFDLYAKKLINLLKLN